MATYLEVAEAVCTPNEFTAIKLTYMGLSQRTIALHLRISRSTVRSRLENARRKIHEEQERTTA